ARSAVRILLAARRARGLPLGRDDPPRLAQVALERVIRDLIEQDADPPAGADVSRVKIDVGRSFDHQRLQAVRDAQAVQAPKVASFNGGSKWNPHNSRTICTQMQQSGRLE